MPFRQFTGTTISIAHLHALAHSSLGTSLIDNGNSCTIRKALREYTETALPAPGLMGMYWDAPDVRILGRLPETESEAGAERRSWQFGRLQ
jgi:hypothetical protein